MHWCENSLWKISDHGNYVTGLVSAKIGAMSAGDKLRRHIHAALRDAGRDAGAELTFDQLEEWRIARAVELEDRREQLQARLDAELAAGSGAATVTNLSAERQRQSDADPARPPGR